MELAEALKEAKQQMSQAVYLCESSPGVYNTGLQSVYEKRSAMLCCLIYTIEKLQAENNQTAKDRDQWKVAAEASRDVIQPQLRDRIAQLEAENERLKVSRPVRCGECMKLIERHYEEINNTGECVKVVMGGKFWTRVAFKAKH